MAKRETVRQIDGLGILLLGLAAVLAILFAFVAQWSPESIPTSCNQACLDRGDLAAQNGMATAAWGMLALAAFSAIVGLITTVFLALTLHETRQGTANAREIGITQVKAYLNLESLELRAHDEDTTHFKIFVALRNTGQSPARGITLKAEFAAYILFHDSQEQEGREDFVVTTGTVPVYDISAGQTVIAPIWFSLHDAKTSLKKIIEDHGACNAEFIVRAEFSDVFGMPNVEVGRFFDGWYGVMDFSSLSIGRVEN